MPLEQTAEILGKNGNQPCQLCQRQNRRIIFINIGRDRMKNGFLSRRLFFFCVHGQIKFNDDLIQKGGGGELAARGFLLQTGKELFSI